MTTATVANPARPASVANAVLTGSAVFWWFMAALGQWMFFYYIVAFYGPSSLAGNFSAWNKGRAGMFFRGYVPGDTAGNLAFGVHALLAGYVAFGGAIQLIPQIRTYAPYFHRWNGRVFLVTALGLSATGLYMVWVRGVSQTTLHSIFLSLNAALIILFGGLAWRSVLIYSRKRNTALCLLEPHKSRLAANAVSDARRSSNNHVLLLAMRAKLDACYGESPRNLIGDELRMC